jgi:RsmE family RNA methyltransferase
MNLLLLHACDLIEGGRGARVADRRAAHLLDVVRVEVGSTVAVGLLGGQMGQGVVVALVERALELELRLDRDPPPRLDVRLVLALPRPKCLRRILQGCAAMGLRELHLINSWRVEKSYWGSPLLEAGRLRGEMILGAEQGRDTILPNVHLHKGFKPFVEDLLPSIGAATLKLVGDTAAKHGCPASVAAPVTLVIGPEGGLIPYEVEMLVRAGFERVSLGPRALRVEHAVSAFLGRLAPGIAASRS